MIIISVWNLVQLKKEIRVPYLNELFQLCGKVFHTFLKCLLVLEVFLFKS